jgi:hypothetical protein
MAGAVALASGCVVYTTDADEPSAAKPRRRGHKPPPPPPPKKQPAAAKAPPAPAPPPPKADPGTAPSPPGARPPAAVDPGNAPSPPGAAPAARTQDDDDALDRAAVAGNAPPLPAQPAREAPPHSAGRPEHLPPGAAAGRPPGFKPGAPAAFWIWHGPREDWRVRTTTAGAPHVFRGHVHGVTGAIARVHPSRTEFHDRLWQTKEGWAFVFKTAGHADGFTFVTRDGGCVRFDLLLDGGPHPKRIFVGKGEISPKSNHFVLCPAGAPAARHR